MQGRNTATNMDIINTLKEKLLPPPPPHNYSLEENANLKLKKKTCFCSIYSEQTFPV